jgi:general secretion pathway protein C
VRWDRVWLIGPGSFCQVEMFSHAGEGKVAPAASASAAPAPPTPPTPGKGVPAIGDDIKSKIQKVSATEFNVDRSAVDKLLENQQGLMSAARVVPEIENGKTTGVRMYGIRPDTLLGTLGMENGDRLEKINGFDMTSPEKALEAYAKLRTADKLQVSVNRRGQAMNIEYNIK